MKQKLLEHFINENKKIFKFLNSRVAYVSDILSFKDFFNVKIMKLKNRCIIVATD
jgi:hypothetical protein